MKITDLNAAANNLSDQQVAAIYKVRQLCDYIGDEAMNSTREGIYNSLQVIDPEESQDEKWHISDPDCMIFSYCWDGKSWRKDKE